jgi:hypothetical protein
MNKYKLFTVICNFDIIADEYYTRTEILEKIVIATSKSEALTKVKEYGKFSKGYNYFVQELAFHGYKITVKKV